MLLSAQYAAGLMDGEGYFGINARRKVANGKTYYASRVTLGMTSPALPVMEAFQKQWGGALSLARKETEKWAEAWAWNLQGTELLMGFLSEITPYLRIKQEQSLVLMELEELRVSLPKHWGGSRPEWSKEALEQAESLKQRMHSLNQKGPALSAEVI